ncbi:hypothetical protein V8F20_000280 [Naviculisporaceae sp. PSN 640]
MGWFVVGVYSIVLAFYFLVFSSNISALDLFRSEVVLYYLYPGVIMCFFPSVLFLLLFQEFKTAIMMT